MSCNVHKRLEEKGLVLPKAAEPAANYVSYVVSGKQIIISGQIPVVDGSFEAHTGTLGDDVDTARGKEIASYCALNVIAQAEAASGGTLDQIRCVRLGVFVAATADFKEHSVVANGASDVIADAFGEHGKHARSAVGVSSLPFGVAVEVDAVFEFI